MEDTTIPNPEDFISGQELAPIPVTNTIPNPDFEIVDTGVEVNTPWLDQVQLRQQEEYIRRREELYLEYMRRGEVPFVGSNEQLIQQGQDLHRLFFEAHRDQLSNYTNSEYAMGVDPYRQDMAEDAARANVYRQDVAVPNTLTPGIGGTPFNITLENSMIRQIQLQTEQYDEVMRRVQEQMTIPIARERILDMVGREGVIDSPDNTQNITTRRARRKMINSTIAECPNCGIGIDARKFSICPDCGSQY